jgi:predicted ribosome quality control (RQC) complex YloA/Tae2 family protein
MHKNYYLFKSQTIWLQERIKDSVIEECFSHQKSELVIKLKADEDLFLRISIEPSHPYILLSKSRNIKGSKAQFFKELTGQKIDEIIIDQYDKIVSINLEKFQLISIFYGRFPNIILTHLDNTEIARFKKANVKPTKIEPVDKTFPQKFELKDFTKLIQQNPKSNIIDFLSRYIIGFNFFLAKECCFRSNIEFDTLVNSIGSEELINLVIQIVKLESEIHNSKPIIYFDNEIPKHISIVDMHHVEKVYQLKTYQSINEAWKTFIRLSLETQYLEKTIKQLKAALNKRIDYLESSLKKVEEFEKLEERKVLSELKGNLLLTFLNNIPRGSKSIKLENIFSEKKELIEIKLNPAKSVQENAQKYFEKFKDIDTQRDRISNRKSQFVKELKLLKAIRNHHSNINSQKEAVKLQELLVQKKLVQGIKKNDTKDENLEHSFRKIVLLDKWNIFIGKNSLNNELLTFKFAHKFDWWFHAQGVPGSHTILRLKNKDEIPPPNIIENVAAVAGFHSSAKHSSSVPVIYTQVRYVRKIRKANPGTVSVLQHKTIFVEPKNL